jgi:hypothetical protein
LLLSTLLSIPSFDSFAFMSRDNILCRGQNRRVTHIVTIACCSFTWMLVLPTLIDTSRWPRWRDTSRWPRWRPLDDASSTVGSAQVKNESVVLIDVSVCFVVWAIIMGVIFAHGGFLIILTQFVLLITLLHKINLLLFHFFISRCSAQVTFLNATFAKSTFLFFPTLF